MILAVVNATCAIAYRKVTCLNQVEVLNFFQACYAITLLMSFPVCISSQDHFSVSTTSLKSEINYAFLFLFLSKQALWKLQQLHHYPDKSHKKTDLFTDLERKAAAKGLRIVDNEGNGNCMFSALCRQLEIKKGQRYSEMRLRTELVQYLKDHPTFVCIFFMRYSYISSCRPNFFFALINQIRIKLFTPLTSPKRPPFHNGHFLLSSRWPLWRGLTVL